MTISPFDAMDLQDIEHFLDLNHIDKYFKAQKANMARMTLDTWDDVAAYLHKQREAHMASPYSSFIVFGYELSDCCHYVHLYTKIQPHYT